MERIHALSARHSIINKLGIKGRIICHTVTHINLMFHCSTEKRQNDPDYYECLYFPDRNAVSFSLKI